MYVKRSVAWRAISMATKFSRSVLLNFGGFREVRYLFLIHFGCYKNHVSNSLQFWKQLEPFWHIWMMFEIQGGSHFEISRRKNMKYKMWLQELHLLITKVATFGCFRCHLSLIAVKSILLETNQWVERKKANILEVCRQSKCRTYEILTRITSIYSFICIYRFIYLSIYLFIYLFIYWKGSSTSVQRPPSEKFIVAA